MSVNNRLRRKVCLAARLSGTREYLCRRLPTAFTVGLNNLNLLYTFGTIPYRQFTIPTIEYLRRLGQIDAAVSGGANR
jgi:hypothetical protein